LKHQRSLSCFAFVALAFAQAAMAQGVQLSWAIHYDPKTFDPALVSDEASETVRALTAGALIRVDRRTLQPVPQLADHLTVSKDGRTIEFHLRPGLQFSDGSRLSSADVLWTIQHILDPKSASPKASLFPAGTTVTAPGAETVVVKAPVRIDSPEWAFDEISIQPAHRGQDEQVTAGPFFVAKMAQGQFVELAKNTHYWRSGYPRSSGIRLEIVANRDQEVLRLIRGEYLFVDPVPPADFAGIESRAAGLVRDFGASLEAEELWFNESPKSPMPEYKRAWFENSAFRIAVSEAINRSDLVRIAFDGHAAPADGFYSPAGGSWRNRSLHAPAYDPTSAAKRLGQAGWQLKNGTLYDKSGHAIEFSIVTNAGNEPRAKMLALIQQDLGKLGMHVTITKLDFPSLIERLSSSFNYDACVLGTTNASPTPESTRNLWLSTSSDHTWNPSEKSPATAWEAELDHQLTVMDASDELATRKRAFDRIQQIIADQQPIIYLVYRDRLSGISHKVTGIQPSVLASPWWNIEELGVQP
jgi:peptide/nickel transport system substrate-binding protein